MEMGNIKQVTFALARLVLCCFVVGHCHALANDGILLFFLTNSNGTFLSPLRMVMGHLPSENGNGTFLSFLENGNGTHLSAGRM